MLDSTSAQLVGQATADLAARLSISSDAIQVVSIEEVEWRDSSLGLPQAGQLYAQVITPGYRIELAAQGKRYRYHTDLQRAVFAGGD